MESYLSIHFPFLFFKFVVVGWIKGIVWMSGFLLQHLALSRSFIKF